MTDVTPDRTAWFRQARFGLFIHWGCYAVEGRGEQVMQRERIPFEEYRKLAERFRPPADAPKVWTELAVRCGMRYAVLTTRHHDGFCLFDTATTDFCATKTAARRDLIRDYVNACRAAGLRIGFYYSLANWRHRASWNPERYADEVPRLVSEVHAQIAELMSNYGPVDILWYDGAHVGAAMLKVVGAADHAAFWRSAQLNARVRQLQPNIIINNRSGTPEDFGTPEQIVRAEPGERPWETCMTLAFNPGWGYVEHHGPYRTPQQLVYHLLDAVRQGGNFLLNVGPRGDGSLLPRDAELLEQVGAWVRANAAAVFGTEPGPFNLRGTQGIAYHMGMWTVRGATAYFTLFRWPGRVLTLPFVGTRVKTARMLGGGGALDFRQTSGGRLILRGLPPTPPDPIAAVLQIDFAEPPRLYTCADPAAWLCTP